jgi:cobalt-zinc-cadmium efflux system protein
MGRNSRTGSRSPNFTLPKPICVRLPFMDERHDTTTAEHPCPVCVMRKAVAFRHNEPGLAHGHHHHSHAPANFGTAFAVGILLNGAFVVAEIIYGIRAHSLALVADAGHNFGDVLGLFAAWGAFMLAKRAPTSKHTYGFRRSSILSALLNAVLLLIATGGILWEAVRRLMEPAPVASGIVMAVAGVGIAVNAITALMFASGRKGDLNIRGAYLHMAGDAAIAFGVVLAGLAIKLTGISFIDPAVSILVALLVVLSTWGLLRESVNLALDAVPEGIELDAVRSFLVAVPGVQGIHDLHIWAMSTTEAALTVHLIHPEPVNDQFLADVCEELHDKFGIEHATLQIERGDPGVMCSLNEAG